MGTQLRGLGADRLAEALAAIVGSEHVLIDPDRMSPFTVDWTGCFTGEARAVVFPADTGEAAAVMAACRAAGVAVLAQGGNTGLVGGSVPARAAGPGPGPGDTVIASTRRMKGMGPVDVLTGQVEVGAGVTIAELQRHASSAGWHYGVDLASRDSATVGGTIATNAGGLRVCAFGTTRHQVESVESVLADGRVLPLRPDLIKDNTGYRLDGLMVGSEGTLGLITRARLRLGCPPGPSTVALISVPDWSEAFDIVRWVRRRSTRLLAAEIIAQSGVRLVCEMADLPWPVDHTDRPFLLLVESEGSEPDLPAEVDAVIGVDPGDRRRLWRYRELMSEAVAVGLAGDGRVHKLDVSLPSAQMPRFPAELVEALGSGTGPAEPAASGVERWTFFGHLADGNIHLAFAGAELDRNALDERVLTLVAVHGGSISGEHGIGRAKRPWLHLSRTAEEIATMRAVKRALDPTGQLAPGVLLPEG
ncbi:MAG: FAD-binding oxidoreductase [Candidatus Nanopelagicales bacterium]|nr:FAD-binding oxidoreductase [Candidatus Nanopelagicales bacterium]